MKYNVPPDESAPPSKLRKIGDDKRPAEEKRNPPKEERGPEEGEDLNSTFELFPEVWDISEDGDAVNVRAIEPAVADGEGPTPDLRDPVFAFRPQRPAVWPPDLPEEEGVELRPVIPRGPEARLPIAELPPQPLRPPRVHPPQLPDLDVGEGEPGPPPRIVGPRPNRVRAPPPDPINRQGGRIGRPGTGSRATRQRHQWRERAQRMGGNLERELNN